MTKLNMTALLIALLGMTPNAEVVGQRVQDLKQREVKVQTAPLEVAKKQVNPAFQDPKNADPKLPNILIIGDSISIGYMVPLRESLAGIANVYRPKTNCGPSNRGLENIDAWLGDRNWDLIQINHGLHDLKYMGSNGQNLANPKAEGSHQQIPPDQYAKNLDALARRLKKTDAKIIWCETTPVPEGASGRVVGDSKKYNEIAKRVMSGHGIETNQLYDHALENVPTKEANVHYSPENSRRLAKWCAQVIVKHLEQ